METTITTAKGKKIVDLPKNVITILAVQAAKTYVFEGIAHAEPIGKGHGPIHHFYELYI